MQTGLMWRSGEYRHARLVMGLALVALVSGCGLFLRVSERTTGGPSTMAAERAAADSDGSVVAFDSEAGDLVVTDTNALRDVFVRQVSTGTTERASIGLAGAEPDGPSWGARLDSAGTLVAFVSEATNLIASDTNGVADVFVRNLVTDTTERVSVATNESELSSASGADACTGPDTNCVPSTQGIDFSADGDLVAFTGLDPITERGAVLVRRRSTGTTAAEILAGAGATQRYPEVALSRDGTILVATDEDTATGDTGLRSLVRATSTLAWLIAPDTDNHTTDRYQPAISETGRFVAFASDGTHVTEDDVITGCPSIPATCLLDSDVFVLDRQLTTTQRVSVPTSGVEVDGHADSPTISGTGDIVSFASDAALDGPAIPDTTQAFSRHRIAGFTQLISENEIEYAADGDSRPVLTSDGSHAVLVTEATNLLSPGAGGTSEVLIRPAFTPRAEANTFTSGTAEDVVLTGEGFTPLTQALSLDYDVTITSTTYLDPTHIEIAVTSLEGTVLGPHAISLITATGIANSLSLCECLEATFTYPTPTTPPSQPTIIVINTDDQRWDSVSQMPLTEARSDWLRFDESFVHEPMCCPSRATMFSGQYGFTNGVTTLETGEELDSSNTLATFLDTAGYETSMAGKYLNGYPFGAELVPPGWDNFIGFRGRNTTVPLEPAGWPLDFPYFNYENIENGTTVGYLHDEAEYSTDRYAALSRSFMRTADPDAPWFVYLAPLAPHFPVVAAPRHRAECRSWTPTFTPNFASVGTGPIPEWLNWSSPVNTFGATVSLRRNCESLLAVDEALDAFIRELEAAGRLDNAYVIFTSDNGYQYGEHGLLGKGNLYEESIRVPLLVLGHDVPPGSTDRLTSNIDLVPTIVDLAGAGAGVPESFFDGESFADNLRGLDTIPDPDQILLFGCRTTTGLADWCGGNLEHAGVGWGIRTATHKYIEYPQHDQAQLFDLTTDPYELVNLIDDPGSAAVRADLQARLAVATASTSTIRGTVTDASSSAPLDRILVEFSIDGTNWMQYTQTDPNGNYALLPLDPGQYFVRFSDPTSTYLTEYHDDSPNLAGATTVTLTGGDTTVVDAQLDT